MGRLDDDLADRVVDAARLGGLGSRSVHGFVLRVVHHHHAGLDALTDDGARSDRAVDVVGLDPVVVFDAENARIVFADPDIGPAARKREHHLGVGEGTVDAPLLMRRQKVEHELGLTVVEPIDHRSHGLGVDAWLVGWEALAERAHPGMVLVELLAARQGSPGHQFMHVDVARVVAHLLGLDPAPGGRCDHLARLCDDVIEADQVCRAAGCQVLVRAAGLFFQGRPRFGRHPSIGLGGQRHDRLAGVDVAFDLRHALGGTGLLHDAIVVLEQLHFFLGVPREPLDRRPRLFDQRAQGREPAVEVRVVAFDHCDPGHGLARDRLTFALLPIAHLERLSQLGRRVVHERCEHHVLFLAQVALAKLGEFACEALEDLPVALGFPYGVHRAGQGMDEGVHVGRAEVVLLVPGRRRQDDVRVHARAGHPKVDRHQQVELPLWGAVVPDDFLRKRVAGVLGFVAQHSVLGADQMLEEVLMPLTA